MKSQVASIPISVNVVPGDEAAGRTQDAEVSTELAFQRAQRAKREATDALRDGNVDGASALLSTASVELQDALDGAPEEAAGELAKEVHLLDELAARAQIDAMSVRKRARADFHMKSRKRGRGA